MTDRNYLGKQVRILSHHDPRLIDAVGVVTAATNVSLSVQVDPKSQQTRTVPVSDVEVVE